MIRPTRPTKQKIISMALCVRMPRPFALITGWMAEPLLAYDARSSCSSFSTRWSGSHRVRLCPLELPNWIQIFSTDNSIRVVECSSTYFIQWLVFVFCFYGRFGAHLADENPRRFIFYDSLFLPNSNPKLVRFAFDMMMMCSIDKPITINISSFSCSYRQGQWTWMNGSTRWTRKQAKVCEMWHWAVAVAYALRGRC